MTSGSTEVQKRPVDTASRTGFLNEPGSVIERVAREIARALAVDGGKEAATADNYTDAVWEDFLPAAFAILTAIREPDTRMAALGGSALRDDLAAQPGTPDHVLARHGWRAMIDAAIG